MATGKSKSSPAATATAATDQKREQMAGAAFETERKARVEAQKRETKRARELGKASCE